MNSYYLGRGAQEEKYENPYNPRITPPPKIHNQYGLDLLSDLTPFGKLCNAKELRNFESQYFFSFKTNLQIKSRKQLCSD